MPTACPTCGFRVPERAERCPQCGRVFGEANRCPHCHAVAAVRPTVKGYVCIACGKPRSLAPGTTLALAPRDALGLARPRRFLLRALGAAFLASAVLGASLATAWLGTGVEGLTAAALVAALGALLGLHALGRARKLDQEVQAHAHASRLERARALLLERPSTVPELAARLGTSEVEADAIATRLAADESRGIGAEIDESAGVVRFGSASRMSRVRIEAPRAEEVPASDDILERSDTETSRERHEEHGRPGRERTKK